MALSRKSGYSILLIRYPENKIPAMNFYLAVFASYSVFALYISLKQKIPAQVFAKEKEREFILNSEM